MTNEDRQKELEEVAKKAHEEKVSKRDEEIAYYQKKKEEFSAKSIERFVSYHPNPSRLMRMEITFAHKDLESIADAMANDKPWAAISGLNPSGPLHFGHLAVFNELLWLQEQGAEVFIPITNDESYLTGKVSSLAEAIRISYELVIPSIIALGFDPLKTHIYVDSDYRDIYAVAMELSDKVSINKISSVFGIDKSENVGTLFYRGAVQLAQILLPQYKEFNGKKPTLILVGIDQHPYLLLARDIAEKKRVIPPAGLYIKFLLGLDGKGKMSASRPESAIFLTDSSEEAAKKVMRAYTGGNALAKIQRREGGIPEICPIYALQNYHFSMDDSLYVACTTGQILCGECKKNTAQKVGDYLLKHQKEVEKSRARINEFLLTKPIGYSI